ncbi:MAG: NUDIX domain-containing protein [Clostridia bacterium]|nr:NUDIX domain-containing protein [Oscillospiraceae bacterium]MBR6748770.1 NUDIX domain-containing protein [Clostridia bacterium]
MLACRITDASFRGGTPHYLSRVSRRAARGVLLNRSGEVALMHMEKIGFYKLPGGGIEGNETPEEAFRREIREETGYPCEVLEYLGTIEEHKNRNNYLQNSYCYIGRTTGRGQHTTLTENEKALGFAPEWFSIDEAIARMEQSCTECAEYGMKFMLMRDTILLRHAKILLKLSKKTKPEEVRQ